MNATVPDPSSPDPSAPQDAAYLSPEATDDVTYRRRVRAWVLYDWANSAFATTIMAALLPAYYSSVAGATLASEATATGYFSLTLSISLLIAAILSPILGTVSDVMRGKKRFLSIFIGIGVLGTGLLVLVGTGDWFLASMLFIIGRIGFAGANVFYDALLPHVAREKEWDAVSTRGYAMGYLGGGLLLAVNIAMFQLIPDTVFENAGIRLSFLSVAAWWLIFSFPILSQVPEPPSASARLKPGESVVRVSFQRLRETFSDLRQYRELFGFLIAFLIYNDAINTIIGLAVIYGAELRFGLFELVLALLLVQFVGIPFSLIFGALPSADATRRHSYLAFILFNLVMLPVVGIAAASLLPAEVVGQRPADYATVDGFAGQGIYGGDDALFRVGDDWSTQVISGEVLRGEGFIASLTGTPEDRPTLLRGGELADGTASDSAADVSADVSADETADKTVAFSVNGAALTLTHDVGPDFGRYAVQVDGVALTDAADEPVVLDFHNPILRYNETSSIALPDAGQHTVTLLPVTPDAASLGDRIAIASVEIEPPARQNQLPVIIGLLLAVEAVGVLFAVVFGRFFRTLALSLDTRRSILLSLLIYSVIAMWGFILDSTIEFWFLAWMVAIVQGGSQALSRSLYASLTPKYKSGEFFGLFSIMSKVASIIGPLLFAGAALIFGSSRPAILSLVVLFVLGGYLLTRVDIRAGTALARAEDAEVQKRLGL